MTLEPDTVVEALGTVLTGPAALHEPTFAGNEWDYVKECLDTGWVSTAGKFVDRFEDMLAEFTGAGHAVATVNGTAALHTSLMLAGVEAGARQVEVTINGIGERAGNAPLEEVAMALRVRADHYGVSHGLDATLLGEASRLVSVVTGFAPPPNKAIVGANAFAHEAGIHQHGVLKDRATYEIMRAEDVGADAQGIRLGRHSGRHGLFARLDRMGVEVPAEDRETVYDRFVTLADQKREVYDADLLRIVDPAADVPASGFALVSLSVSTGTGERPHAEVTLLDAATGDLRVETATGDGPVDAIYRALDGAAGRPHRLETYSIRALTQAADAQGEALVVVSDGPAMAQGKSTGTDILRASAEAYVAALNGLDEDNHREGEVVADGIMASFDAA